MTDLLPLTPALASVLAATPCGHEDSAAAHAFDIARALGLTIGQAANALGKLKTLGLVESDKGSGQTATWARYDSFAPGLTGYQSRLLGNAEHAAPSVAQDNALESFGPCCPAAPDGLAVSAMLPDLAAAAVRSKDSRVMADTARAMRTQDRPRLAINLYRMAAAFSRRAAERDSNNAKAAHIESALRNPAPVEPDLTPARETPAALSDKTRAYDAPALVLPFAYILTAWAEIDSGCYIVLTRLPDNKVTPFATFLVSRAGDCHRGDYQPNAKAARAAYLTRLTRAYNAAQD